jgi:phosphoribosylformylglycinamidine cyclo-ligase
MMARTYADAGVDIEYEHSLVKSLTNSLTFRRVGFGGAMDIKGHYAGLIDMGEWALAITTDGVGSKLLIAHEMKKYDTIGIDCVAMNVNDIYCVGAEPLALVDYLAVGELEKEEAEEIGKGLCRGAELAGISVVGGETAILPEIVKPFDLAGTCVGIVRKDRIITGERIEIGDVLIGIPSSGLHSNGYTLVRKLIEDEGLLYKDPFPPMPDFSIGDILLTPTRIYSEVMGVVRRCDVHGLAHITGGGLTKLSRLSKFGFEFSEPLPVPPLFEWIKTIGGVDDVEMYRTFNMGMGFVIVLPPSEVKKALKILKDGKVVGRVVDRGIWVKELRLL